MTKNALKNLKFLGAFFLLMIVTNTKEGKAQETVKVSEKHKAQRKFTIEWGYNRSNYTNSDITFKGSNYDFTLYNAKAKDNPEKFDPKIYINPFKLTIPQFNFRLGYFFNKNWSFTVGWDHMKYILDQNQIVNINGVIDSSLSNSYDGIYSNQNISLPANFLRYEHSDGCNYVRLSFERNQKLIGLFDDRIEISGIAALGCGAMVPWTDVTWFGTRYKNWLHLAGYAINAEAAIKTEFFKRFFFKGSIMKGYVNMNDILITGEKNQRASQHFGFTQWYLTGGMNIYFNRTKEKNI
jgi:hypothetical protein